MGLISYCILRALSEIKQLLCFIFLENVKHSYYFIDIIYLLLNNELSPFLNHALLETLVPKAESFYYLT